MIPGNGLSPAAVIAAHAAAQPDRHAITFLTAGRDGDALTFGQLHADAQGLAAFLQGAGINSGDIIVIAGEHDRRLVTAFVAALYAGAVPTIAPYPSTFSRPALFDQRVLATVEASRARAVWGLPPEMERLKEPLAARACRVLDLWAEASNPQPGWAEGWSLPNTDPATPVYVQFSSGTTGTPKGALVTQAALARHLQILTAGLQLTAKDVLVGWAPFYHDLGLVVYLLLPLICAIPAVTIAPDHWVRRPQLLLKVLEEFDGTVCTMPSFGFAHTTRNVRERDVVGLDLRNVRHFISGAEVVQPATLDAFADRFQSLGLQPEVLRVGYGMTECVFMASMTRPGRPPRVDRIDRAALLAFGQAVLSGDEDALAVISCGNPMPETQIQIIDDAGNPLPERQVGEIVISSPSLFTSYVGRPDLTDGALRGGRLFTGDLGYISDGELFVVDRKKDLIIAAGKHIYPEAIEQIALAVLAERGGRAAAFGLPSAALGTEAPVLVCEMRGQTTDEESARLSRAIQQQVMADVEITLADVRLVRRGWLEITTSGKVARSATREKYLAAGFAPPTLGTDLRQVDRTDLVQLEQALGALAAQLLGVTAVQPQDNLFDLGADSLTAVRFVLTVEEQTAAQVGADFFAEPTIAHLAQLLSRQSLPSETAAGPAVVPAGRKRAPRTRRHEGWVRHGPLWRGQPLLPYGLGVRLQRAWLALPGVRNSVFADDMVVVRRWSELVGAPASDDQIVSSLLANTWRSWRNRVLAAPLGTLPWVKVTGERAWWEPPPGAGGVIYLLLHSPLSEVFSRGLRAGGHSLFTIGVDTGELATPQQERARQVYRAQEVLRAGGVVTMGGDGGKGDEGVVVPFFGGRRLFRQGGADLAVQSGAQLIPVFCTITDTGRVEIQVCPPLERGAGSTAAQVERLTRAYAELVVARWPQVYHCLSWGNLATWLNRLATGKA